MASAGGITYYGPWAKLAAMLDPGVTNPRISREMGRATRINGLIVRKAIRAELKSGMAPANAPLTVFIKGSSKPGIDHGEMFKAITSVVINPFMAEIGVKKGDNAGSSALAVHEGATIRVTPKMRAMFGYLADVSAGKRDASRLTGRAAQLYRRRPGGWKALKQSTTHIRIPARPFIAQAMEHPGLRAKIGHNWTAAWAAGLVNKRFKAVT
jgi:hypothetical protein